MCRGKYVLAEDKTDMKLLLKVLICRLAAFQWCMLCGASWKSMSVLFMNSCSVQETFLSRRCNFCLIPVLISQLREVPYVWIIYGPVRDLSGSTRMAFEL